MNANYRHQHVSLLIATVLTAILVTTPASAQVYMVEEINEGPGGTYIFRAGALGFATYFSAYDGVHGEELWVSDGTAEGTYLVADIWPDTNYDQTGAYSSKPENFIATSAGMYFGASHREDPDNLPNHDYKLWFSTGEAENATQVSALYPALGSMSIADSVVFDDQLFIAGWDETYGVELWKVTGTSASRLTNIEPDDGGCFPNLFTVVGGQLFFQATNSATYGSELWVTDGTVGGEHIIDIVEGVGSSFPTGLTSFDGKVYFQAFTYEYGSELWVSDGTPAGTEMVADIRTGYGESSNPWGLVPVGDQLFFMAEDTPQQYDLWVYDGAGARRVKPEGTPSALESIAFDGRLFFVADDPEAGRELWVSDGTGPGTGLFVDIYPGTHPDGEGTSPNSSDVAELTVAGEYLFFSADDGLHGPSLWVSDGTSGGTFMVANLFDYWSEEGPKGLTATTDRLFFQTETDLGREVHALRTLNVISPPAAPTGETSGLTEATYTYSTTGGSISLAGGAVQYRFIWGDGESTDWLEEDVKSAEHSWAETGTYAVTVEARSVLTDTVTSNASDERSVSMTFDENVTVQFSDGPETGEISVDYEFSFTGESDYGHDLEFQVDWGDGNVSEWAAFNSAEGESLTNAWDNLGDWPVVVTLRCAEHYSVTFSAEQSISIVEETIDTPTIDGPSTGEVGAEYTFTVDGNSSAGHDLQYFFNWGDGSDSGWIAFGSGVTSAEVSHEWGSAGAFGIEVGVRCATHDYLEAWSDSRAIEISPQPNEELTGPSVESSWDGYIDASNSFTLSTSSNLGHELEYQVDWGDGSGISWTAFGEGATSVQLSHTWTSSAEFDTVFTARCIEHQDVEQSGHWTMFVNPEVVSDRSLSGPSSGVSGMSYDYTLTAQSASGHSMQYQVYWGHGDGPGEEEWFDINPANGTAALSHSWPIDGADHNYQVDYGVRCKTHNDVQEWASIWVSIPGETITNHTLDGPTEGLVGVDYDFTVTGVSPGGHSLEYKFEWGDGFPTDWAALNGGTAGEAYHWAFPGEFTVKASVRCATHNHVLSEKEQLVTITSDTPPGWIFGDGFESGNLEAW